MTTIAGTAPVSAPQAQATQPALPGFVPGRQRIGKHDLARPPRPAVVGRAGLFPWVPVCLSVGIAIWFALSDEPLWWQWVILAIIAATALTLPRKAIAMAESGTIGWRTAEFMHRAGLAVALAVMGIGLIGLRSAHIAAPILEWRYYGPIEGRVVHVDRSARDRFRLTLDRLTLEDVRPERAPRRVRISLMDEAAMNLPRPGEHVRLTGHLGPPPGPASPGSFDFRWHAWFAGLGAVGYSRLPVEQLSPPEGGIWRMHRARLAISKEIQDRIGGQNGAVAAALMTGDRSGIEEATNKVMRASNLYHIISISGLHMGMLAGFVYASLRYLMIGIQASGRLLTSPAHKIAAAGAIAAASIYLWLSGGGVATERAFIMVAVMLTAIIADRRAISLRTVALAATVILVLSPEALTSPGFQMSFAATIALILIYGPWSLVSPRLPFLLRPVLMLITSSLVAGMATAPIAAAHFNQMTHYGLVANLLVVPVMGTLVMPAGVIAALLGPLGLAEPALWVMGIGTEWMLYVAEFVAGIGGAVTAIPLPPSVVVPLMGFGAVVSILCWRRDLLARPTALPYAGFAFGTIMLASAAAIWVSADRPLLLIDEYGEAAGVMIPPGRAVSKASGGSFVIRTWLRQDGDTATQEESAGRTGWAGDRRNRHMNLPDGWQVWHFTGKGAGERAAAACLPRRIVIAPAKTGLRTGEQKCVLFDLFALRRSGSVEVNLVAGEPRITTVRKAHRRPQWDE